MNTPFRPLPLFSLLLAALAVAQQPQTKSGAKPKISVIQELPDPPVPGSCTESYSGYITNKHEGRYKSSDLTMDQVGSYVLAKMAEGYSLELYPQPNHKIFAIENCHQAQKR